MRFPEILHAMHAHAVTKAGAFRRRSVSYEPKLTRAVVEVKEKHAAIVEEAKEHGIDDVAALNEATDAYQREGEGSGEPARSDAARYVEALLILAASDQSGLSRNIADVVLGVKTSIATAEVVEAARATIKALSVQLGVSALSPWTPAMPEYRNALEELMQHAVHVAEKRVELRVTRLLGVKARKHNGTATNTSSDKASAYVFAACIAQIPMHSPV